MFTVSPDRPGRTLRPDASQIFWGVSRLRCRRQTCLLWITVQNLKVVAPDNCGSAARSPPPKKFWASEIQKSKETTWDSESYVYWTVHHLDSWRDQLDITCFIISLFNAQHVSAVNTSILRSLRLICWVISWVVLLWYVVCWCYVVVWLGWCGVVSGCRFQPA